MRDMKELTLSGVALAALCMLGCGWADRPDVDETTKPKVETKTEPKTDRAVPATKAKEVEAHGDDLTAPPAVSPPHEREDEPTAQAPKTRDEYIAASRRRLDEMERELQQLETRSKERGKELRKEIREEKRKLDADLARMSEQTDEAWTQMKDGFADALERLEGQIREVRKDIDPDA